MLKALLHWLLGREPDPVPAPPPTPPQPPPPKPPPVVPPFQQPAFTARPDRPPTTSQITMRAVSDAEWDYRRNVSAVRNPYATSTQNSEYRFHYEMTYERLQREARERDEKRRRDSDSSGDDSTALLAATVALDHSISNDNEPSEDTATSDSGDSGGSSGGGD